MTSKKRQSWSSLSSFPCRLRLSSRLIVPVLVFLSILSIFSLNCNNHRSEGPPKIAFLFLVRDNLPLDFLWHSFFKNANETKFSIYIHSKPGFVFDESTTVSPFFYGRQLSTSIRVGWGEPSMIQAERLLFKAALSDPDNHRFVLLSDSCVPLYNFSCIYNYLMSSPKSYVESFLDATETRYSPKMSPVIPKKKWRKGSQWITLVRRHAEVLVHDNFIFPVFKKFCKRRPLLDLSKPNVSRVQTEHNCIPDEHYVQTLFMMRGLTDDVEKRTLTYSLWIHSKEKMDTAAWHPVTFDYKSAEQQHIKEIKGMKSIFYESENRTEGCYIDSREHDDEDGPYYHCYLFARKFSRSAAIRLLTDGLVGPYDLTAFFQTYI